MALVLRRGKPEDAAACGKICFEAFKAIAEAHNFPPDFNTPEPVIGVLAWMLGHPRFYVVVAELDGRIVGSNCLDGRDAIAGIGPITVDPASQNMSVGRQLMENAHHYALENKFAGVRLIQAAYHLRSLSLYTRLGYEVREPLACIQGAPLNVVPSGLIVRSLAEADLDTCNRLCRKIHGYERGNELRDAIGQGTATVVERDGRIVGYASMIGFFGHAVAENDAALEALIGAAGSFAGPGFLVPTRNAELFRWCLDNGLRIVQPMTLMSRGDYQQPSGAFLPSILY